MDTLFKYPSTAHLQGSRLQAGDDDHAQVPYTALAGRFIVVEEKMDGANSGIRFDANYALWTQSRGHYLTGGGREKHFDVFKAWAAAHESRLLDKLEDRFLMFGEWMRSKHTVFYDCLPHLFLEFDIYDTQRQCFLSTAARRVLLAGSPVTSVPVLYAGVAPKRLADLVAMIQPSLAKTVAWRAHLREVAVRQGLDPERILAETDSSDLAEGLYLKVEEDDRTVARYKWVRADFLQTLLSSDSHWLSRPIIPNQLAPGVDIYADTQQAWPVRSPVLEGA